MSALPNITLTTIARQRLVPIATAALASERDGLGASMLLGEIARATVVRPESLPPDVVDLECEIDVRDNVRETTDRVQIVYPGEEDGGENKISVLTPIGAALIGLSQGASIDWCTTAGDRKSFTVIKVRRRTPGKGSNSPSLEQRKSAHAATSRVRRS